MRSLARLQGSQFGGDPGFRVPLRPGAQGIPRLTAHPPSTGATGGSGSRWRPVQGAGRRTAAVTVRTPHARLRPTGWQEVRAWESGRAEGSQGARPQHHPSRPTRWAGRRAPDHGVGAASGKGGQAGSCPWLKEGLRSLVGPPRALLWLWPVCGAR